MGDYDQFTEVAVFPMQIMDSQLPPGMLRNKMPGMDKSIMGLEMCGGGGGGGSTHHHHHQNPYDDAWIRDWTRDAEGREEGYIQQLANLEQAGQEGVEARNDLRAMLNNQLVGIQGLENVVAGQASDISGLRGDLSEQTQLISYGLEGLQAAQIGLETATTGIDQRLAGQAAQVDAALTLAQQGWTNELALAEAGWDATKTAWEQQTADWASQFAQQQRAAETQLVTEREEYEAQLANLQNVYGIQREADRTAWEQQAASERAALTEQLSQYDLRSQLERQEFDSRVAQQEQAFEAQQALTEQQAEQQRLEFARQLAQYDTRTAEDKAAWDERYAAGEEAWDERYQMAEEDWQTRTAEQQAVFEQEAADRQTAFDEQRQAFSTQIEQFQEQSAARAQQRAQEWETRFAQSQETQRIQDAIESRDLEAQLSAFGNQYQQDWATKSAEFKRDYEDLISQASTDAERARLEQAARFEGMQQDQAAAYNQKTQELAAQDRVFDIQLDELRRDLGIETDLLGSAQQRYQEQQDLFNRTNAAEQARLQQSLQGLGQTSEAARQELASELTGQQTALEQSVTGQLGDFRQDIADYKDTLAGQKAAQDEYYAANKRFREMQIQDAERARVSASYGTGGRPLNKEVKGVRRAGSSSPGGVVRSRTPRQVFHRSGLRISSLNI